MFKSFVAALGVAIVATTTSASAAVMQATFTGQVRQFAFDRLGLFGSAGADLGGRTLWLSFVYDTSLERPLVDLLVKDMRVGGPLDGVPPPITSVTIDIGGVSLVSNSARGAGVGLIAGPSFGESALYSSKGTMPGFAGGTIETQFVGFVQGHGFSVPNLLSQPFAFSNLASISGVGDNAANGQ